jgi:DNA-binding NarL/FixJ family response regulator
MPVHERTEPALAPELEAIATAAAERLRAQASGGAQDGADLQRAVAQAASAAIDAGAELDAVAQAQRIGQHRARRELGSELLRRVERAAKRKRDAEREYEDAVLRAAVLGLAHREIATAASVAHGTVRAIVARTETPVKPPAPPDGATNNGSEPDAPAAA